MTIMPRAFLSLLLVVVGCGEASDTRDGGLPPDGNVADGPAPDQMPGCQEPAGPGTEHNDPINASETWTAEDSPHVVTSSIWVHEGTLTIEPCAVVRIRKGCSISVGGTAGAPAAAIVAHGESIANAGVPPTVRPVTFLRDDDSEPWGMLYALETGMLDLEVATLEGGGDPDTAQNYGGTIVALGAGGTAGLTRNVRTVDVTIEGSGGFGVNLQNRAAFTEDSTGLKILDSGRLPSGSNIDTRYPLYVQGAAVSTIPEGSYTGNGADEIFVAGGSSLNDPEVTFFDRGVPYRLESTFGLSPVRTAANGGLSTLIIEAGVVMRFASAAPSASWALRLGISGGSTPDSIWPTRLIANGTAEAPIVLTSAEESPAPGDWAGIHFRGGPATGNVMSHVRIEYAGGDSGTSGFGCGPGDNDAALIITNWRPEEAFITDSAFVDSAAGGIVCGWRSDLDGPDLVGNNTFTNIANGCNVARWSNATGTRCPGGPPLCF